MNFQWDSKLIKPIFYIVEAKGPILLGLPTLRRMVLFLKHAKVFIASIDIQDNLVRCVAGVDMSDNDSVSDTECLDPEVTEIMDVTEEWVDTENIDSKN